MKVTQRDQVVADYLHKIVNAEVIDPETRREFNSVIAYLRVRQQIVDYKESKKKGECVQ